MPSLNKKRDTALNAIPQSHNGYFDIFINNYSIIF